MLKFKKILTNKYKILSASLIYGVAAVFVSRLIDYFFID